MAATTPNQNEGNNKCMVSFGEYHGHKYKSTGEMKTIGEGKCLVESKWMQVMQHTVRLEGKGEVIDDWLFIDYHDRINVLVSTPSQGDTNEPTFLVFQQSKYSLEGRQSLAIIGGIIEPGEDPKTAAQREVNEEMNGMVCDTMEFLGRYRTDVNRGIGWVNSFLALGCVKANEGQNLDGELMMNPEDEVGKPDTERQDLIKLSSTELLEASREGKFLEVQWSNTVALALLHLR